MTDLRVVDLNKMEIGDKVITNRKENFMTVCKTEEHCFTITITKKEDVNTIFHLTTGITLKAILESNNRELNRFGYKITLDIEEDKPITFKELYNKVNLKISNCHNDILRELEELELDKDEDKIFTVKRIERMLYDINVLEESRDELLKLYLEERLPKKNNNGTIIDSYQRGTFVHNMYSYKK